MNPTASFAEDRNQLVAQLHERPAGAEWCRSYTDLIDRFIVASAQGAAGPAEGSPLSVIAVGGYGRREMAPYSDVDLLVVPNDDAGAGLDESVRRLHRALLLAFENAKGPAFSYAFFLQNDASALDFKTLTACLDARPIYGPEEAARRFLGTARKSLPVGEFLADKIQEREAAHSKTNDTPLVAEPNLKEGSGGLRSFHAANWLLDAIGQNRHSDPPPLDDILRLRNLLHVMSERPNDLLTRARQAEIADRLNVSVRDLFDQTASALEALHRIWLEALSTLRTTEFGLTPFVRSSHGVAASLPEASQSQAGAGVALAVRLGLEVREAWPMHAAVNGPEALFALSTGEKTLRGMDRAGVLKALLPELEACRTLMPGDAVHVFTVFEHSIRTVRNVEGFPAESFYGRLRDGLSDSGTLYLAALLHDVGKAVLDRPHSESGAEIVRGIAARWELAPGTAETLEWLVREHLTLARFIGMRDVSDPAAVAEFAAIVGDRERLDMLAVLTCADVSAVAPNAWTPAQDAFLRELHERTAVLLETETASTPNAETMRRRVVRSLRDVPVDAEALEEFLASMPAQYAVHTAPDLVPVHMELAEKARNGEPSAVWDHRREQRLSELTVCAIDRPGLLNQILGVLYAYDLSVFGLRANTTAGAHSVALDTVLTSFGHQLVPPATGGLVVRSMRDVLLGEADLGELLRRHGKDPERRQDHFRCTFIEGSPGILEVQAPRGRGMAYRLSRHIWRQGWNIVAARFGQWAGQGAAAFYLLGSGGAPLTKAEVERAMA